MAKTRQFTIAVDHRPGAVANIATTLGNAKVNILALLGTAQGTAGSVQIVVENPRQAKKALEQAGLTYKETAAEIYELPNKPGALGQWLGTLAKRGLNLNSIHATAAKRGKKAVVVYTIEPAAPSATPVSS